MDNERPTDPEVDESRKPYQSPIEQEFRDNQPGSPEVRDAGTFLGIGAGTIFAILLGLFVVLTAYFIVS